MLPIASVNDPRRTMRACPKPRAVYTPRYKPLEESKRREEEEEEEEKEEEREEKEKEKEKEIR